jgi:hypothetical protein
METVMFKSVLFLLLRVLGAVILGGMLFASVWGLFILPSMGWDLVRWDYYEALKSGRMEGFIFTFVRGTLHIMLFVCLTAAIPMLVALFCSVIGWSKPAAKIWGFFDYLHALGNKKCAEH